MHEFNKSTSESSGNEIKTNLMFCNLFKYLAKNEVTNCAVGLTGHQWRSRSG